MSITTTLPPAGTHFISIDQAADMTARYRKNQEVILDSSVRGKDILALSETFNRDVFDELLLKPGCAGLRIYYGMDADLKVHAIIVGTDEKNSDILASESATISLADENFIGEEGQRCPNICPPKSPLNGG